MIAVLGSTGTIGSHVSKGLSEAGADFRDVRRADGADLRDRASLEQAFAGASDLFLLTPGGPHQEEMEQNALDAALAAGVERIVKISGGAPSLGPNGATPTAVAHWRSEQRIEQSGLKFQFLRPSFLMQNLPGIAVRWGVLAAPMGRGQIAMVDARDVADCAVALLTDGDAKDGAWQLTGPSGVTFSDVARLRGARYLNVPARVAQAALERQGASAFEVDHAIRMARYFASGADGTPTSAVPELTGHPARSLEDFLQEPPEVKGS